MVCRLVVLAVDIFSNSISVSLALESDFAKPALDDAATLVWSLLSLVLDVDPTSEVPSFLKYTLRAGPQAQMMTEVTSAAVKHH